MELNELDGRAEDFEAFHSRFAPLFGRSEGREQAAKHLHGLLSPLERKNSWQLAEAVGDPTPDATQRLLYSTRWVADAARDELQRFVSAVFGDPEGIGVVDETGLLRKGTKSAGVQRQYSGTAGKTESWRRPRFVRWGDARRFPLCTIHCVRNDHRHVRLPSLLAQSRLARQVAVSRMSPPLNLVASWA